MTKPSVVMSIAALAGIAALIFIVAREGVAQLQDGGGVEGVVVADDEIASVGDVLGVVQIPHVVEGVDAGGEEPVEGEAAEDALLLALVPVDANVEFLRVVGSSPGT